MCRRTLKPISMKKFEKQNHAKIALFAGATALMSLTPNIRAQTSMDALLNKLEQKGVLTVDEAKELKAENATNSVADLDAAMNSKFPMSGWITSYKLSGDFRGRFDERTTSNPAQDNNIRMRYRLRVGLQVNMKDNLQVGFRLGSADPDSNGLGGSPVSNNTTLQGNGTKKFLYVDAAYGKWTPINDETWMIGGTIGKMDNPFQLTPMVFDPDYTPEGGAIQATYKINDKNSLAFNGAAFVLSYSGNGPENMSFFYGEQTMWNAAWSDRISSSLGISVFVFGVLRGADPECRDPRWHGRALLPATGCWLGGVGAVTGPRRWRARPPGCSPRSRACSSSGAPAVAGSEPDPVTPSATDRSGRCLRSRPLRW